MKIQIAPKKFNHWTDSTKQEEMPALGTCSTRQSGQSETFKNHKKTEIMVDANGQAALPEIHVHEARKNKQIIAKKTQQQKSMALVH